MRVVPTIRSRLALLVTACVLPASLMAVLLISYDYQRERTQLTRDAIATARALASAVDRDLAGAEAALLALATSPHLKTNNLAAFYSQAQEVLQHQIANNIILIDSSGQQHLNTLRPFGAPLPARGNPPQLQRIFETGRPVITDLFVGPVAGRPLIAIGVPVRRDDAIIYSLDTGIFPERLARILAQQRLPSGWIAGIFDSTGAIVARSRDMERFLGQKGPPALVQRMTEVAEDALETVTAEGIPALSVFSRSTVSNWTVVIAIPRAHVTDQLWHSLWWLILATALLLGSSLGLAWAIGGDIARTIRALTGPALALGYGERVMLAPLHLKEADEVGAALMKASSMLRQAQYQAHHDLLTGLANRALFNEIVDQQLALCQRVGAALAILYIDLDGFKPVNDKHGHAIGDALLCAVAARLKTAIRGSDVVSRLGGDEFALVLLDADVAAATEVAGQLVESLSIPYPIGPLTLTISASIGVAAYPACGANSEALLQSADQAMYQAKTTGKRRYAIAANC